jgi:hypothetical protein
MRPGIVLTWWLIGSPHIGLPNVTTVFDVLQLSSFLCKQIVRILRRIGTTLVGTGEQLSTNPFESKL